MPLSGTFDTMQLTDVIQWLHSTRQSGTLTVSVDLEDTHLVFKFRVLISPLPIFRVLMWGVTFMISFK